MELLDWTRLRRRRSIALALPRLVPLVAPWRPGPRVYDDSSGVDMAAPLLVRWPDDVARPRVGLVQDLDSHPYWTKHRRFLQANSFDSRLVDIHASRWMDDLGDLDMVVWRPSSQLYELDEARRKVFFMGEFLGLKTYPTLRSVNLYEDKILQSWVLQRIGVETPATVASFDEADALRGIAELGSEVVWKLSTGSGSCGVERLSARRARAAVRRAFSARGRRTYWPYANQKGYVYAQALEHDLRTDMRIIVVGPLLFGYYRDVPPGEFRASGMNRVRMEALPCEALEKAWNIALLLGVGAVAIDFITDREYRRHKVIEFSSFIKAEEPEQLIVDGDPGVYVRQSPGCFEFRLGRYWLQELALAEALCRASGLDSSRLLLDAIGAGR